MWRPIILASVGFVLAFAVKGQVKKQFSVENKLECKKVALTLKAKTGNCFISTSPSHNQDILNIYSNQNLEEYDHTFSNEVIDNTCAIKLTLEPENMNGVSHRISYKVFGANERASASDKFWKVYLTENTSYLLDLDYGLGNANIDLSGLSIEKLKINTASADINIGYKSLVENKITMDTFSVKVDMGSLNARQLNLAKAKILIAEVGFGNMMLDFGNKPKVANHIIGSVGAGNLIIQLPDEDVPVIITINDSWLCSIQMARSLKKIGPNKYANAAYSQSSTDALRFDLDVSMGKIVFRDKN